MLAGVFGFAAVALGAFGAHALQDMFTQLDDGSQRQQWWETASQYHLAHALALGLVGVLASRNASTVSTIAGACFVAGMVLFSGSLYTMTLTGARWLGAVTPFGGLLLLAGWLALAVTGFR